VGIIAETTATGLPSSSSSYRICLHDKWVIQLLLLEYFVTLGKNFKFFTRRKIWTLQEIYRK